MCVLVSYGGVRMGLELYYFIMNLLDQLFQYSLRSESSSISFSALDKEQNLQLSSISLRSFTQSTVSPSMAIITPANEDMNNRIFALKSQESGISMSQMETYMRVKDKYRKLSKMVEMFGNKIRKIQYEFLVKLENRCKDCFNFKAAHERKYVQQTKQQIMKEISKDISVFVYQKILPIHVKKHKEMLRLGFDSILKKSFLKQRFEYFGFSLNSVIKHKMQSNIRLSFNILKQKSVVLSRNIPKSINIQSKRISVKQEEPILSQFNDGQRLSTKIPIVHPQRRQTQNIEIGDNLSIVLLMNQDIFQSRASQSETLQASILKNNSEIQFKTCKKRSELTNASGTALKVEECLEFQTQCGLDQKCAYEVALFKLSQSACFKQRPQQCLMKYQIAEEDEEFSQYQQINEQTKRFSLQDHQDDLNRYIIFRRSIEKKRDSTLKDIQKSKQTIKRIVYELQKSKTKNQKQKIKLASKKPGFNAKFSERKIPIAQSKASSPTRPKAIGIKSSRASPSKNCMQDWQVKVFSTRDNQNSENYIIDELQELQTPSKNMEVYYNYLKAKRKSLKLDDYQHKKGSDKVCKQGHMSKNQGSYNSGKKGSTSKHRSGHESLLVITKDPALRERRIDVKVDLTKPMTSARTKVDNVKGMARKGRK